MAKKANTKKLRSMPVNFGMLDDAVHAVLDGVQGVFDGLETRFDKLNTKIDFVHTDLKREIDNLKYDTPTMKEFNTLKSRVDSYNPTS